jgi:glycosyltransferase involved in cell wall biosynthesis
VPYRDVPLYIGAAHVTVAAFPGDRGAPGTISSLKTLTYLACGRPLVTTIMDELADAVVADEAGRAVPPDDPGALAAALLDLLEEPPPRWRERCERAAALVRRTRSWHHVTGPLAARLRGLESTP